MSNLNAQDLALALTVYVVLLFSVSFHESAHAWAALKMGDDTAARQGRISLNPAVHIDPIGTVLMPALMFLFGGLPLLAWAKPTPYDPANFRREVSLGTGHMAVAAAGPASNIILALAFTLGLFGAARAGLLDRSAVAYLLASGIQLNIMLAMFNMIPIPPLDGSKVASWALPRIIALRYDAVVESLGPVLPLLVLLFAGRLLSPINQAITQILIDAAL